MLLAQVDPNVTTPYLILGYVVISVIALIYVLILVNKQRNLKQDIELMSQLLKEDKEEGGG
jgi:hypothetical protein